MTFLLCCNKVLFLTLFYEQEQKIDFFTIENICSLLKYIIALLYFCLFMLFFNISNTFMIFKKKKIKDVQ